MNRIILRNVQLTKNQFKIPQFNSKASSTCALFTNKLHTNNQNQTSLRNQPKIQNVYKTKKKYIADVENLKEFKVSNEKYQRNHLIGSFENKEQCLKELKQTSDYLLENLKNMPWLRKMFFLVHLKYRENSKEFSKLKISLGNNNSFNQMINFMHANIDKFDIHEKSTIFKLVAVIDQLADFQINKNLTELLLKLEIDFYDNIDKCNLYDINNYNVYFKYFSNSKTFFYKKSIDRFYRLLLNPGMAHQAPNLEQKPSENLKSNENIEKVDEPLNSKSEIQNSNPVNTSVTTSSNQLIDDINNSWLEHELLFKESFATSPTEKNYFMRISLMRYLPFITPSANNELMINLLNDNELKKILSTNTDALAHLLICFNSVFGFIPYTTKQIYRRLIIDNYHKILEYIQQTNNYDIALQLVEVLINNMKKDFTHSVTLLNHFQSRANQIQNPVDFSLNLSILSKLLHFRNDMEYMTNNKRNLSNFFVSTFDPLYSGIIENFDENVLKIESKKNESNGFSRPFIQNYYLKLNQVAKDMNIFSINLLTEAVKVKEFRWITSGLLRILDNTFDKFFSNNIENLNLAMIYMDTCEAFNRFNRLNAKIYLSDTSLDNLMKLATTDRNKLANLQYDNYSKFIGALVATILYNPSYATSVLSKLEPKIDKILQQNNTNNFKRIAIAFASNYDYYLETNPNVTIRIMNKIFKQLFTNLLDFNFNANTQNHASLRVNMKSIVKCLMKIDRTKLNIDQQFLASLSMENSNKKLEEYLNNFQANMDQLSNNNSYEEVKNYLRSFEKTLLFYSTNLEIISRLLILANHYNPQMILDICSNCIKNLTIFGDSLFNEIISGNVKISGFNSYFILDFLTFYGLFNYFDSKVIRENEKLSAAFDENLKKLSTLNDKIYKQAKEKNIFNDCSLIEYILRLLNIGIQHKEAINDLFNKIKSVEDINRMFDYMDGVKRFD
jgi:hypothetical protein